MSQETTWRMEGCSKDQIQSLGAAAEAVKEFDLGICFSSGDGESIKDVMVQAGWSIIEEGTDKHLFRFEQG